MLHEATQMFVIVDYVREKAASLFIMKKATVAYFVFCVCL